MTDSFDAELWRELESDSITQGLVRRRVLPALLHDAYIGELRPGRERILMLALRGAHAGLPARRQPSRGLKVAIDDTEPDLVRIDLTSTSRANGDLFAQLASDVLGILAADPGDGVAGRVLDRVVAWQNFFAARRDEFSPEQAAGLYSELYVLREAFLPVLGATGAVAAWSGPDPAVQDFQVGTLAMEVKSFRGTGPGQLLISSERQLELVGLESLFIAYLRLDERQDGTGWTLGDMIESVREAVGGSAAAVDLLEQRVLSYGWLDSYAESRSEKYEVRTSEAFRVTEAFPRIVPPMLAAGVGGVSYGVDRSAIEAFIVSWRDFAAALRELS